MRKIGAECRLLEAEDKALKANHKNICAGIRARPDDTLSFIAPFDDRPQE